MPALQTITAHGVVSALATAVTAKRLGRTNAGWPSIGRAETIGTDYGDAYSFTNGTGTNATTIMRYGSAGSGLYQNYLAYTTLDVNGLTGAAPLSFEPQVGSGTARYSFRDGSQYRSLSYKPSSGSAYGVHIYQRFDSGTSRWLTVDAEIYVQPQNKPTAFNENQAASTLFLAFEGYINRWTSNSPIGYYDGYRWMYVPTPYTGWAGSTPLGGTSIDYSALITRNCRGTTGYAADQGSSASSQILTTSSGAVNVDYFARSCEPMQLGVWDLDVSSNCKLATPFILRHKMRPIGTAGADFYIGPNLDAGFEVTVSASEKYWSLGGSLFLRQA